MSAASKGAPPQWMSTHPASSTRINEIEQNLAKVMPLFERAPKPGVRYDVPARTGAYLGEPLQLSYWGLGPVRLGQAH